MNWARKRRVEAVRGVRVEERVGHLALLGDKEFLRDAVHVALPP